MKKAINELQNSIFELKMIVIDLCVLDKGDLPFIERKKFIQQIEYLNITIKKQELVLRRLEKMEPINLLGGDYIEIKKQD